MIWHSPFWFLMIIPLVIACFFISKIKRSSLRFSSIDKVNMFGKPWLASLPVVLKILSLMFLIIALARPKVRDTRFTENIEGIDIIFTLDISSSMLAQDMQPSSRLEAAKQTISNFINKRHSDRMGLVLFAAESFTEVPATTDYALLLNKLFSIKTDLLIKAGTAIGVAIANSVARLKFSNAKSKVIILLTDGENNSGTIDPLLALNIAKKNKVKIYTIGVGKDGDATIPIIKKDPITNRNYKTYTTIYSRVNVELLNKLASETGGKFYRADNTKALSGIFDEIDSLEKTEIETNGFIKYNEIFYKPLTLALILFSLSLVLKHSILRVWP